MKHLLSAADLTRDDAVAILDNADRFSQALLGREIKKLRRCAAAPLSRCSTRTPPAPGCHSRWRASG